MKSSRARYKVNFWVEAPANYIRPRCRVWQLARQQSAKQRGVTRKTGAASGGAAGNFCCLTDQARFPECVWRSFLFVLCQICLQPATNAD